MKRIIVCIKPVPDPKAWHKLSLDPVTRTLVRQGIPVVINPLDKNALEAALALKDATGAEVVLLSMAPPDTKALLMEALAMGADRACLLSDRVFAGSDSLATARILAAAIGKIGAFDVVLCGNYSLDGSTAQVPSELAQYLGIPNVMHVEALSVDPAGVLTIVQTIEQGRVHLESASPLLLSVTRKINKPRFCSFLEMLKAEKKDVALWSNADLSLDPARIGLSGSPTRMVDLFVRPKRRAGQIVTGEPEVLAETLKQKLYQLGVI
jgi:electron transfer flavoprotein beta subunit